MTLTCTNVTLRQKPLRNDRISLYLDYYPAIRNPYTMKMSRREFLGIYIFVSNSLRPHGLQHARLPCPSLSPRVCLHHVH